MTMSKEAVKDKMKDANTVVLNVLSEADFAKLHIKGSENLPFGSDAGAFAQAVEKKYGKEKFFITYCASLTCDGGPKAAKALQEKGFKATDYAGGTKDWSEAGFSTEGTEAKAPIAEAPAAAVAAAAPATAVASK
jgi:rhodanese-related sulfurtransferase